MKITTTTNNQIQFWPFIYKPGEHRQQSKGEKNPQNYEPNEFDRMRVEQFLSETVAMYPQYWSWVVRVSSTNQIPYASDAMVSRCRSTMRRLDNLKGAWFLSQSQKLFSYEALFFTKENIISCRSNKNAFSD